MREYRSLKTRILVYFMLTYVDTSYFCYDELFLQKVVLCLSLFFSEEMSLIAFLL